MHLAGTYLASPFARWHSFADYYRALESDSFPEALADLDEVGRQPRDNIKGTWDLSLDGLDLDGRPQARQLLLLLSCYAPATPIPIDLLQPMRKIGLITLFSKTLAAGTGEDIEDERRMVREGLNGLATVGLIDINGGINRPSARAITVHPVIADANRARLLSRHRTTYPQSARQQ